jgi:hypothetical protein
VLLVEQLTSFLLAITNSFKSSSLVTSSEIYTEALPILTQYIIPVILSVFANRIERGLPCGERISGVSSSGLGRNRPSEERKSVQIMNL